MGTYRVFNNNNTTEPYPPHQYRTIDKKLALFTQNYGGYGFEGSGSYWECTSYSRVQILLL